MTIVKYTNKKTGVVTLYESTSHYDPVTKQSRPVRKYLGRQDPVTGELIPSSGKRGKQILSMKSTIKEQQKTITALENQKASLVRKLSAILEEMQN